MPVWTDLWFTGAGVKMLFKREPSRQPQRIKPHIVPAVMIQDAASVLPSQKLCNTVLVAIADNPSVKAEHIEALSNALGRLAHDRSR